MHILSLIITEKVNNSSSATSSYNIKFDGRSNVVNDVITSIDNINKIFGDNYEIKTNDQYCYYDIIGNLREGGWNLMTSNSYFDLSSLTIYKSFYFESNKIISNTLQQEQQQAVITNSAPPRRSVPSESLQSQLASITPTERDSLRSSLRESLSSRLSISGAEKRPSLSSLLDYTNDKQQLQQQQQQQQQQLQQQQQQQLQQQRSSISIGTSRVLDPSNEKRTSVSSLSPPPPPPPPPAAATTGTTIPPPATRNSFKALGGSNSNRQSPIEDAGLQQNNFSTPTNTENNRKSVLKDFETPSNGPIIAPPPPPPPASAAQLDPSTSSLKSIFGKPPSSSETIDPSPASARNSKTNVSSELDYKNSELFKRLREEQEQKKKNENSEEAAEAKVHDASKTAHFTRLGAAFSQKSSSLFSPRGGRTGPIGGRGRGI